MGKVIFMPGLLCPSCGEHFCSGRISLEENKIGKKGVVSTYRCFTCGFRFTMFFRGVDRTTLKRIRSELRRMMEDDGAS